MSELAINRTPELIAAEINNIKDQTKKILIYNSIEIGRRLTEVKLLVPHGEWGAWLEEKVNYSKSTANNLMRIFEEYADDQMSLLDNNAKSQSLGKLTYTQAIELLKIPGEEREKFIEENKVEDMSTRELKKTIAELNKAKEDKELAEKKLAEYKSKSNEEKEKLKKIELENKKLTEELNRTSDKLLNDLRSKDNEVLEARREVEEYKTRIKEFEERPVEVITGVDESKVKELEEEHKKKIELLMAEKEAAENKLKELENKVVKHNENKVKFKLHFDEIVAEFKNILIDVNNIKREEPEEAEKYSNACKGLINKMLERL